MGEMRMHRPTFDSGKGVKHTAVVNERRTFLSSAWRIVALVTLFTWVFAFGLCTAHCGLGKDAPMKMTGASGSPSTCSGGCPGADPAAPGGFCLTVKSMSSDVSSVNLQAPDATAFLQAMLPPLLALDLSSSAAARLPRQADLLDRVFTPEVYLGPAFRSHAPPVLL